MDYQLVLQWPASSIEDYDALIEIEERLIERLREGAEVDGHDFGSGEMNIFLWTTDPVATFTGIRTALADHPEWASARAAYREPPDDEFTVLWPENATDFRLR